MVDYRIEIAFGHDLSEVRKAELRDLLCYALGQLQLQPCWVESLPPEGYIERRLQGSARTCIYINDRRILSMKGRDRMPSAFALTERIRNHQTFSRRFFPAWGSRLLSDKLWRSFVVECPLCWVTYLCLMVILLVHYLPLQQMEVYALFFIALLNLIYTWSQASRLRSYFPLSFQTAGYALLLTSKKMPELHEPLLGASVILLLLSALPLYIRHWMRLLKVKAL